MGAKPLLPLLCLTASQMPRMIDIFQEMEQDLKQENQPIRVGREAGLGDAAIGISRGARQDGSPMLFI